MSTPADAATFVRPLLRAVAVDALQLHSFRLNGRAGGPGADDTGLGRHSRTTRFYASSTIRSNASP